jgi:hypothetical protein
MMKSLPAGALPRLRRSRFAQVNRLLGMIHDIRGGGMMA